MIDTVSVDKAFFGKHDPTAKLVLMILREHKCRWTEALPSQSNGGQVVSVVKSVVDMVRRKGQRLTFRSEQEPSVLD